MLRSRFWLVLVSVVGVLPQTILNPLTGSSNTWQTFLKPLTGSANTFLVICGLLRYLLTSSYVLIFLVTAFVVAKLRKHKCHTFPAVNHQNMRLLADGGAGRAPTMPQVQPEVAPPRAPQPPGGEWSTYSRQASRKHCPVCSQCIFWCTSVPPKLYQ